MELEIRSISSTVTDYTSQLISSSGKEAGELFNFSVKPEGDAFLSDNDNDDVTIRMHNETTGNTVSKTTRGGKLIAKYVENNSLQGSILYDREGNLRTLDYHELNKKFNTNSFRLEIKDGEYTLKYRDGNKRILKTQHGDINELNLESLGLSEYMDVILNAE